jgi:hypothetical protein
LRLSGDFDGDARTDLAYVPEDGSANWRVYLSDGDKWKNAGVPAVWGPGSLSLRKVGDPVLVVIRNMD